MLCGFSWVLVGFLSVSFARGRQSEGSCPHAWRKGVGLTLLQEDSDPVLDVSLAQSRPLSFWFPVLGSFKCGSRRPKVSRLFLGPLGNSDGKEARRAV